MKSVNDTRKAVSHANNSKNVIDSGHIGLAVTPGKE
jgi:hypothetical protein